MTPSLAHALVVLGIMCQLYAIRTIWCYHKHQNNRELLGGYVATIFADVATLLSIVTYGSLDLQRHPGFLTAGALMFSGLALTMTFHRIRKPGPGDEA